MISTLTRVPDVVLLQPKTFQDKRGFFMETWNARDFEALGISAEFVQDNHSQSTLGSLRGLHYQIKHTQGKLIRVTRGEIFDVAVDLRRSASTFGQWTGELLSAENLNQLWVPPGFAHGFLVLSDIADVAYKCTDYYSPEWERTLRWDDPDLGIEWPLPTGQFPLLSEKDKLGSLIQDAELFP